MKEVTRTGSLLAGLARWPIAVLSVLCLLAWLPGFAPLPPLDRDESRFAQSSKQMVETGDWIDIRFSTVPRYNKPIGIYWMQAAATKALGRPPFDQIWTYRVPSLLGALIAVFLCYWCCRALAPPETSLIAAALLAMTMSLSAEAHIAKTDAMLLAAILGSQGVMLRCYLFVRVALEKAPSLGLALAGWIAIGIGILLKGPVILAVLALTAVSLSVWDRDWRWLKYLRAGFGIPLALAIVLPWGIAIGIATHGAFYQQSLGHDFASKIVAGQETHGGWPGYYLVLASVTLWPVTLFALPAIGAAITSRTDPAVRYLLCWLAPNWAMFELVPTKLPHYILPVYPALAMLAAVWVTQPRTGNAPRWQTVLRYVAIAQFALALLAFIAVCLLLPNRFGSALPTWTMAALTSAEVAGAIAVIFAAIRRRVAASIAAIGSAALRYPGIVGGVAPSLGRIWMSPHIAERVAADRAKNDPPPVLAGYVEPSLVFELGTGTHIENGKSAAATAAQQGGLALIEDHERGKFLAALKMDGGLAKPVDGVSGFNYSKGRNEHVTIFRVTPAPPITEPPPE